MPEKAGTVKRPTAREGGVQRLYHYQGRNLGHLKDTLITNRVHCANPENLNDPWDCRPYFDDVHLDNPSCRDEWIKSFSAIAEQFPEEEKAKASAVDWSDKLLEVGIKSQTLTMWKWIPESFRIYCLTPHPASLLMWAHYGDRHYGVCLEFDATLHFGRAYQVNYADKMPLIRAGMAGDGQALIGPLFCTKSSEWSYEDEYRLVMKIGEPSPPGLKLEGDYLVLPPRVLTGIVAGHESDIAAIRALVREYAPGIAIKRAVRRYHEYHLDIVDDE